MRGGIGRQRGCEGDEFGFGIVESTFVEQELYELNAGIGAVGVGLSVPDSVHRIVVIASGIFDGTTVCGDTGESQVDGGILRGTLPEGDEVGFSFVETARIVAV